MKALVLHSTPSPIASRPSARRRSRRRTTGAGPRPRLSRWAASGGGMAGGASSKGHAARRVWRNRVRPTTRRLQAPAVRRGHRVAQRARPRPNEVPGLAQCLFADRAAHPPAGRGGDGRRVAGGRDWAAGCRDARRARHAPRLRAAPVRGCGARDGPRRAAGRCGRGTAAWRGTA